MATKVKKAAKPAPKKAAAAKNTVAKKPAVKPAAKKTVEKKAEVKKPATKVVAKKPLSKAPAKKAVAKSPAKKVVAKAPAKKVAAKTPAKKVVAKAPAKKIVAKAPAKKVVAKAPAKKVAAKAPAKKVAAKAPAKKVVAKAPEKKVVAKAPAKKVEEVKKATVAPQQEVKAPQAVEQPKVPTVRYSDEDLQMFKKLILEKLAKAKDEYEMLRAAVTHRSSNGVEDTSPSFQVIEEGAFSLSKEESSQLANRQYKFIQNLEAALVRIENKTYGISRKTGKLIPKARLLLVPHATLNVEDKESR